MKTSRNETTWRLIDAKNTREDSRTCPLTNTKRNEEITKITGAAQPCHERGHSFTPKDWRINHGRPICTPSLGLLFHKYPHLKKCVVQLRMSSLTRPPASDPPLNASFSSSLSNSPLPLPLLFTLTPCSRNMASTRPAIAGTNGRSSMRLCARARQCVPKNKTHAQLNAENRQRIGNLCKHSKNSKDSAHDVRCGNISNCVNPTYFLAICERKCLSYLEHGRNQRQESL
jgi:hypothetical protein